MHFLFSKQKQIGSEGRRFSPHQDRLAWPASYSQRRGHTPVLHGIGAAAWSSDLAARACGLWQGEEAQDMGLLVSWLTSHEAFFLPGIGLPQLPVPC